VCDLKKVLYLCSFNSRTPKAPVEVPIATYKLSKDTSKDIRTPSCLACKINSEKSEGQTLKNMSAEPVMQYPAEMQIDVMLSS